jgi:rhodanese-related sulfurtransferase
MDWELTAAELKQKLDAHADLVLLDVREPFERATAAIEPSLHIPMGDIPSRVQELDPDKHIVVYCHHGVRSLNVTSWLRQQGFETVQSLRGGIDRWSREINPKIPLY